jgi:RNA polymerase sigma-32 factor
MFRSAKSNVFVSELSTVHAMADKQTFLKNGEEKTLADQLQNGTPSQKRRARDRLVLSHMKFALKLVRENFANSPVPTEELAQQAMIGLLLATNKYDGRAKFSTYAYRWVLQTVKEYAVRFNGIVHTPLSADRMRTKIRQAAQKATGEGAFLLDALAEELGLSAEEVVSYLNLGQESSLNAFMGPDSETERLDFLVDPVVVDPIADTELEQRDSLLARAMALLDVREREILLARWGIGREDEEEETLEMLAQRFEVSRERIRQIQVRAQEKLANCEFAEQLRAFL